MMSLGASHDAYPREYVSLRTTAESDAEQQFVVACGIHDAAKAYIFVLNNNEQQI